MQEIAISEAKSRFWKPKDIGEKITGVFVGIEEGEYKGEKTEHINIESENGNIVSVSSSPLVRTFKEHPEFEKKKVEITFNGFKMFGNMQGRNFSLKVDL